METWRTRISEAFWYNPKHATVPTARPFAPAMIPAMHPTTEDALADQRGISWLDALLHGGVHVPDAGDAHGLTILIAGRPGAGKSVLATELCYRWATGDENDGQTRRTCLYVAAEAHVPWIIEKSISFGWKHAREVFRSLTTATDPSPAGGVFMMGLETFEASGPSSLRPKKKAGGPSSLRPKKKLMDALDELFLGITAAGTDGNWVPDVLVVDSLNTIDDRTQRTEQFKRFTRLVGAGPRVVIIVLDAAPEGEAPEFWEFLADIVIRLDVAYESGYMVRKIEVSKARYQPHAWGRHQLKIYEPFPVEQPALADSAPGGRLARAHPYREEGGIFIFPSIHYYLSVYKRSPLHGAQTIDSGIPGMSRLLPHGYPKSRCTALIGKRGGHKSHLGYVELLHRIVNKPGSHEHRGLVVSLRDDEGTTRNTMDQALSQQWPNQRLTVDQLEREDRLEIMYYPPGYITPEEFFHRLLLSIQRLKSGSDSPHVTLLFNSLDQLGSRFPLCAKEHIFVPGIVQMLSAEGVSSFFVAAREEGQDPQYYGLESIAELLLTFDRSTIKKDEYQTQLREHLELLRTQERFVRPRDLEDLPTERTCVAVEVSRFAGGRVAGAKGALELIDETDGFCASYGNIPGLHLLSLSR